MKLSHQAFVIGAAGCCLLGLISYAPSATHYFYPLSRATLHFDSDAAPGTITRPSHIPPPEDLYSTLIPTLESLLLKPILSHHASLKVENTRCPNTYLQTNQDQLKEDGWWWKAVSRNRLRKERRRLARKVVARFGFELSRKSFAEITDTLSEEGWAGMWGDGRRGLVCTAGNGDTSQRLLTSLKILRHRHKCTLPVEIWGFAWELRRMGTLRQELEGLGDVTFREASASPWHPFRSKQFPIKGEAIAHSSFSEVLYLDSDNVPTRDPSFLFNDPLYKENGIVLWPDITKDAAANPIWRMLSTPCDPDVWQAESGQVLVSKLARGGMNLAALFIAEDMQRNPAFWFRISGGDKDTFRYAFYFLSLPYTPSPHWLSIAGDIRPSYEGHTFCGHTTLQYGLSRTEWDDLKLDDGFSVPEHAPPLFEHSNLLKHSGNTYSRGDTFRVIKSATPDAVGENLLLREDTRTEVYHRPFMCTDIWDASGTAEVNDFESGRVAIVDWTEAWGGMLRGFEDMFYEEGGRAGGM